jgi:hypothetical protein
MADVSQPAVNLIINKFGDKVKKVQCHAINNLVKVVRSGMKLSDEKLPKLIITETLLFLQRPSTKPSHRLYCLGFLNKFASIADSAETRSGLL